MDPVGSGGSGEESALSSRSMEVIRSLDSRSFGFIDLQHPADGVTSFLSKDFIQQGIKQLQTDLSSGPQTNPFRGEMCCQLGHLHLILEEYDKALSAYQQCQKLCPESSNNCVLVYGLALIYFHYNAYKMAENWFLQILQTAPGFGRANEVHLRLAMIARKKGDIAEALEHYQKAASIPGQTSLSCMEIQFHIGHLQHLHGLYLPARHTFESILSSKSLPNNIRAKTLRQLGWLYHTVPAVCHPTEDAHSKSLELLKLAVGADPSSGQTWYFLGRCHAAQGRAHEAFMAYQQAVNKSPDSQPNIWCSIGILYHHMGQPRDSLQAYLCGVYLDTTHVASWSNLGCLYEAVSQPRDALLCYKNAETAIHRSPTNKSREYVSSRVACLEQFVVASGSTQPRTLPTLLEAWYTLIPSHIKNKKPQCETPLLQLPGLQLSSPLTPTFNHLPPPPPPYLGRHGSPAAKKPKTSRSKDPIILKDGWLGSGPSTLSLLTPGLSSPIPMSPLLSNLGMGLTALQQQQQQQHINHASSLNGLGSPSFVVPFFPPSPAHTPGMSTAFGLPGQPETSSSSDLHIYSSESFPTPFTSPTSDLKRLCSTEQGVRSNDIVPAKLGQKRKSSHFSSPPHSIALSPASLVQPPIDHHAGLSTQVSPSGSSFGNISSEQHGLPPVTSSPSISSSGYFSRPPQEPSPTTASILDSFLSSPPLQAVADRAHTYPHASVTTLPQQYPHTIVSTTDPRMGSCVRDNHVTGLNPSFHSIGTGSHSLIPAGHGNPHPLSLGLEPSPGVVSVAQAPFISNHRNSSHDNLPKDLTAVSPFVSESNDLPNFEHYITSSESLEKLAGSHSHTPSIGTSTDEKAPPNGVKVKGQMMIAEAPITLGIQDSNSPADHMLPNGVPSHRTLLEVLGNSLRKTESTANHPFTVSYDGVSQLPNPFSPPFSNGLTKHSPSLTLSGRGGSSSSELVTAPLHEGVSDTSSGVSSASTKLSCSTISDINSPTSHKPSPLSSPLFGSPTPLITPVHEPNPSIADSGEYMLQSPHLSPPDPPPYASSINLKPDVPIFKVSSKKQAFSDLHGFCTSPSLSVCIIQDMVDILGLDLEVFSTQSLVETCAEHEMEVREQVQQAADKNWDPLGKRQVWKCESSKSVTTVKEYATYQTRVLQQTNKEEDPLPGDFTDSDGGQRKRRKKMLRFGTNVDLSNTHKWRRQLRELEKLPKFLQVDCPESNFLGHIGHTILGMNSVQLYMKVPGSRTPGHQENNNFCSVNINIGPGDCEWFAVPNCYWGVFHQLCEKHKLSFLTGSWWPVLEELYELKVPVYRFTQYKGEVVWINAGTVHWVQANSVCNNIAWNVGPLTAHQLKMAWERYQWNKVQKVRSIVPMIHLTWNVARSLKIIDSTMYQQIRTLLETSLAQTKRLLSHLQKANVTVHWHGKVEGEPSPCCQSCLDEVFNILFVLSHKGEYLVYCHKCASYMNKSFTVLQQYDSEELEHVLSSLRLHRLEISST